MTSIAPAQMYRISCAAVLLIAVAPIVPLGAVDNVLVPLEMPGREWSVRIRKALEHVEAGRHREGIEILQSALLAGGGRGRESGGTKSATVVVEVPPDLDRDATKLRQGLDAIFHQAATAPPVDPDAGEGPSLVGAQRRRVRNIIVDPTTERIVLEPRVTLRERGPPAPGRRFVPLDSLAEAALRALPPGGLVAYRGLYDGVAAGLLAGFHQTGDREPLERVAREFFLTGSGAEAAELLGDLRYEVGDFNAARGWWRKVLNEHPSTDLPRARLCRKLLWSLRILGERQEYLLERQKFLDGPQGDGTLVEALERAVPLVPREERPPPRASSKWGGELWFARPPELLRGPLHLSWDSWLWSREGIGLLPDDRTVRTSILRDNRFLRYFTSHFPFLPVADGGSIYLSGVFSLYRIDGSPSGGSILMEYRKPIPRELAGYVEDSDSPLYTTTVWRQVWEDASAIEGIPDCILVTHYVQDRVKALLYRGFDVTVKIPIRALAAFDEETGRILWTTAGASGTPRPGVASMAQEPRRAGDDAWDDWVDAPGEGEFEVVDDGGSSNESILRRMRSRIGELGGNQTAALKDFSYTSPAIVKRGLVVAGGWAQRGYVNVSVRALDLRTGALVWETPLVNSGMVERTLFGEMAREPFWGAIAEEDGVVYYVTQMGAVAAVELDSGRVRWLSTYDSIVVQPTLGRTAIKRDICWGPNPVLLLGHVLIAAPRDSEYLYAIDTGRGPGGPSSAGKILWKYANPLEGTETGPPLRDLLGYLGGRLYLGGPTAMVALDLTSMDAFGVLWKNGRPVGEPERVNLSPRTLLRAVASGLLTKDGIVFADKDTLQIMRLDPPGLEDSGLGPFRDSEWGLYPGRVQVSEGMILMTSRHLLSAYVSAAGNRGPAGVGR